MRFLLPFVSLALSAWNAAAKTTTAGSTTIAVSEAPTAATSTLVTSAPSTAAGTSTSLISTAASPGQTPGFVNNGTVGSYPCAVANGLPALVGTTLADCPDALQPVYPYNTIDLRAPDDSIRASFLPAGAAISEFWVKDRNGVFRDIVLGFDNKTNYGTDEVHPYFGPQVGRYANRIKDGTFTIDGKTYHTPLNENGRDTLHGGFVAFDRSSYQITSLNSSAVTFTLHDPDGNQGFPGAVVASATYILENNATYRIEMDARVTDYKKTPIMLSSHVYWNLAAYNGSQTILDHIVHTPQVDKYIKTDEYLIPTGEIPSVNGTVFDFRTPRAFSERFNETVGVCGASCQGWDTCFVMSSHARDEPVLEMTSPASGIKMSVTTDQDAFQLYTCNSISGALSLPRKRSQGGDDTTDAGKIYDNHSCVVIELEDYIDGINNPQWHRDQVYSKHRPYQWHAEYRFSTVA